MPMHSNVAISFLPATSAADQTLVAALAKLINDIYAVAEAGIWLNGASRTSDAEVAKLVGAGEMATAHLDGKMIGAIRIQDLNDKTGEFGILVTDPAYRHHGVGRALIDFAENTCRQRGREVMQLEILSPKEWPHPTKEKLKTWYGRLGYQLVAKGSLDDDYPHLTPLLATACDFLIYHKPL